MTTWDYPVKNRDSIDGGKFGSTYYVSGGKRYPRSVPHSGHDYPNHPGQTVRSAGPGTVKYIDRTDNSGWGLYVWIDHGNNVYSGYAHLASIPSSLKVGQKVTSSTKIGTVGTTGSDSKGYHLHWTMGKGSWTQVFNLVRSVLFDPVAYVKKKIAAEKKPTEFERQIGDIEARQRTEPSTRSTKTYDPDKNLKPGTIIAPKGYVHSDLPKGSSSGSNVWLVTPDDLYVHVSSFTNKDVSNLTDLTVYPEPEPEAPVEPEQPEVPQDEEPEKPQDEEPEKPAASPVGGIVVGIVAGLAALIAFLVKVFGG